jgi:hypothetical protein
MHQQDSSGFTDALMLSDILWYMNVSVSEKDMTEEMACVVVSC